MLFNRIYYIFFCQYYVKDTILYGRVVWLICLATEWAISLCSHFGSILGVSVLLFAGQMVCGCVWVSSDFDLGHLSLIDVSKLWHSMGAAVWEFVIFTRGNDVFSAAQKPLNDLVATLVATQFDKGREQIKWIKSLECDKHGTFIKG